jgi:sulfate adenylyltransferase
MIKPHGADTLKPLFVYDTEKHHALMQEAETLPSVVISSAAAGNAVMMGGGYFTPLSGFMNVADAMGCAEGIHQWSLLPGPGGQPAGER